MISFIFSLPIIGGLFLIGLCLFIFSCYIAVSSNKLLVRTGLGGIKIIRGSGIFVFPIIHSKKEIDISNISLTIRPSEIVTKDQIKVNVEAVSNVKVLLTKEGMDTIAVTYADGDKEHMKNDLNALLEGKVREIIAGISFEDLIGETGKQAVNTQVKDNIQEQLNKLGFEMLSFTIKEVKNTQTYYELDEDGHTTSYDLIDALSAERETAIKTNAIKNRAEAEKQQQIAKSSNLNEANAVQVKKDTEIAIRENELKMKKQELIAELSKKEAEAEMAKSIELAKKQKELNQLEVEATTARAEKEIELKEKMIALKEKELDANIKKQADADLYQKQKQADADLYTATKEAEKERVKMEQEAEGRKKLAEAIKATGIADAEAIKAKLLAEAEGLQKKAEASQKMNDSTTYFELEKIKIISNMGPEIAKGIAEGYSKVGVINMYGGDSTKLHEGIMKNFTQINDAVKQSTGIDLLSAIAGGLGAKLLCNNKITEEKEEIKKKSSK